MTKSHYEDHQSLLIDTLKKNKREMGLFHLFSRIFTQYTNYLLQPNPAYTRFIHVQNIVIG